MQSVKTAVPCSVPSSSKENTIPNTIVNIPKRKKIVLEPNGKQNGCGSLGNSTVFTSQIHENFDFSSNLGKWELLRRVKQWLPEERTTFCQRRLPAGLGGGGKNVSVVTNTARTGGHFRGLACCNSVWGCPVCAPLIAERRAIEVSEAFEKHYACGGMVLLFTFTFPHQKNDKLKDLKLKFSLALKFFKSGRFMQDFKSENEILGTIRSLEITYGENGFHLHSHEAVFSKTFSSFVDSNGKLVYPQLELLRETLAQRWRQCVIKAGLGLTNEHGFDLRPLHSATYLVKQGLPGWGGEKELVKGHAKTGKNKNGLTPWDLLQQGMKNIFVEYYYAMKGSNLLRWSRGLKKLFGIKEIEDEKLETEIIAGTLTPQEFDQLIKHHAEGIFLDRVLKYGFDIAHQITFSGLTVDFRGERWSPANTWDLRRFYDVRYTNKNHSKINLEK